MTPSQVPATPLPTLSRPLPECHFGLFRFLYCLCLPSMNMSLNNTGLDLLVSSFIKNAPEILLPLALLNSVICVSNSPTWMPVAKIHSLSRAYSIFHCVRVPQLPLPSPADGPLGGHWTKLLRAPVCSSLGAHAHEVLWETSGRNCWAVQGSVLFLLLCPPQGPAAPKSASGTACWELSTASQGRQVRASPLSPPRTQQTPRFPSSASRTSNPAAGY